MTTRTLASFDTETSNGSVSIDFKPKQRGKEVEINDVDSLISKIRKTLDKKGTDDAEEKQKSTLAEAVTSAATPALHLQTSAKALDIRPLSTWIKDVATTISNTKIQKHMSTLTSTGAKTPTAAEAIEPLLTEIENSGAQLAAGAKPPPQAAAEESVRILHGIQMAKVDLNGQYEKRLISELMRYLPTTQRALRAIVDGASSQLQKVEDVNRRFEKHANSTTNEFSKRVNEALSTLDKEWTTFLHAYFREGGGASSIRYLVANANHEAPLSDRVQRFINMERASKERGELADENPAAEAAVVSARSDLRHTDEQMERVVSKMQDVRAKRATLAGGASDVDAIRALDVEHGILHDEAVALSGRRLRAQRALAESIDQVSPSSSGLHAAAQDGQRAKGIHAANAVLRKAIALESKKRSVSTVGWKLGDVLDVEVKDARYTITQNAQKAMNEVRDNALLEFEKSIHAVDNDFSTQMRTLTEDANILKRDADAKALGEYAAYWQSALRTEQAAVRRAAARQLRKAAAGPTASAEA